jgi:ankyrin repeat protein
LETFEDWHHFVTCLERSPEASMLIFAGKEHELSKSDSAGNSLIQDAITILEPDVLSKLLSCIKSSTVNIRNTRQESALHFAVFKRLDAVDNLINLTPVSSFDHTDLHGRTALHMAALSGSWDLVRKLKNVGCSVDVIDIQGRGVIHYLVHNPNQWNCWESVAKGMYNYSPCLPLNVADNGGWTPLHLLCKSSMAGGKNSDVGIARMLLEAGADPNRECPRGWTPRALALLYGHEHLERLFRQRPTMLAYSKNTTKLTRDTQLFIPEQISLSELHDRRLNLWEYDYCYGCFDVDFSPSLIG